MLHVILRALSLATATWACTLLVGCGGAGEPAPRSLLLVMLDTTRADHLSCYGYERETTPVIDALADSGLRFDAAYAQSSLTPVSTGSLLTGTHPYRHGVRSLFTVEGNGLDEALVCLPELFLERGYRTAGFVSAAPMGAKHGFAQGFEVYSDDIKQGVSSQLLRRRRNLYQRRGDIATDEAIAWLDEVEDEPFFLLLHMFDAHDPSLVPPRAFLEEHSSLALPPALDEVQHLPGLSDPEKLDLYDAELRYMDEQVGRLLAKLDETGAREETVVVVLADHGEGLGQHDFWTHGLLWGEQLRVPLVIAGPGLPRASVISERARVVDLLPTLAELFDLRLGDSLLDGRSLMPLVRGVAEPQPRELYAEVHHAAEDNLERDAEMYTLTVGPWKYIHRPVGERHELYRLDTDPLELENIYTPDDVMARFLHARLGELGAISGTGASLDGLSEADLEALRQMGYL